MCGCWRLAVVLISATNRSVPNKAASSGFRTFRNLAIMPEILREVHRSHTTDAELADDAVPIRECSAQAVEHAGHGLDVGFRSSARAGDV